MRRMQFLVLPLALAMCAPAAADIGITIEASTTFSPLVRDAASDYHAINPGVTITVDSVGSRSAAAAVVAKSADAAFVDSKPDDAVLLVRPVFTLPLVVVAQPGAGVTGLKRTDIARIFTGEATNWRALGGADVPIHAFTRPPVSAMSAAFKDVFGRAPVSGEILVNSGEVTEAVRATPGGVGFATLSAVTGAKLSPLTIDGHKPDEAVGPAGYPFFALGFVVTNGAPPREVSRFLAFLETRHSLLAKYGLGAYRDIVR